jgi:hypothetical protein
MNVKEIIRKHLVEIGADGLCRDECGCGFAYFIPCGAVDLDCVQARKVDDPNEGEIFVPMESEREGINIPSMCSPYSR